MTALFPEQDRVLWAKLGLPTRTTKKCTDWMGIEDHTLVVRFGTLGVDGRLIPEAVRRGVHPFLLAAQEAAAAATTTAMTMTMMTTLTTARLTGPGKRARAARDSMPGPEDFEILRTYAADEVTRQRGLVAYRLRDQHNEAKGTFEPLQGHSLLFAKLAGMLRTVSQSVFPPRLVLKRVLGPRRGTMRVCPFR